MIEFLHFTIEKLNEEKNMPKKSPCHELTEDRQKKEEESLKAQQFI